MLSGYDLSAFPPPKYEVPAYAQVLYPPAIEDRAPPFGASDPFVAGFRMLGPQYNYPWIPFKTGLHLRNVKKRKDKKPEAPLDIPAEPEDALTLSDPIPEQTHDNPFYIPPEPSPSPLPPVQLTNFLLPELAQPIRPASNQGDDQPNFSKATRLIRLNPFPSPSKGRCHLPPLPTPNRGEARGRRSRVYADRFRQSPTPSEGVWHL
jgi:hypothetical protein